jgi:hypothetical protein
MSERWDFEDDMLSDPILYEADRLINGQRQETYGPPHENFARIARLWDAYIKNLGGRNIRPKDVAMMMVLLKMARLIVTSVPVRDQRDSVVDMAGYVGLLELIERGGTNGTE